MRKCFWWKHCKYKEWVSFFWLHGEWIGARNKQIAREHENRFSVLRFVCAELQFIPLEPRKKDTHSLKWVSEWVYWLFNITTRQRKAWHPLAGGQSWPWSMTPWPKINRVPPLIMVNVHVKFESNWIKTEVAIVSTRSYTQSAKVDHDLWPRDPNSIGFLLSSSTTYM